MRLAEGDVVVSSLAGQNRTAELRMTAQKRAAHEEKRLAVRLGAAPLRKGTVAEEKKTAEGAVDTEATPPTSVYNAHMWGTRENGKAKRKTRNGKLSPRRLALRRLRP